MSSTMLSNALVTKLRENPKNTVSSINYTTQFITNIIIRDSVSAEYKKLYSQLEVLCGKKEKIVSEDNEVRELENFLSTDQNNIFFLVESLTSPSAICALEMYHLHYEAQNDKLLDYTKIKEDSLLRDIYLENGANAHSFAITTAVYFFQNNDFDFQ